MGYCVSCAKDVKTAKFCPTCGRQLLSTEELKAEVSASERSYEPVRSKNNLALWVHLAPLIAGFVAPIAGIIFIVFWFAAFLLWLPGLLVRNSATATDFDKRHATESMNFQFTILIFSVAALIFSIVTIGLGLFIVVPAAVALGIAALIFMIMGSVAANEGREYRYPLTIRFVK
jgi:uncharacterized Tic20 family protein